MGGGEGGRETWREEEKRRMKIGGQRLLEEVPRPLDELTERMVKKRKWRTRRKKKKKKKEKKKRE